MLTATGTISALGPEALTLPTVMGARHIHVSSYFLQLGLAPHLPDLFAAARDRGVSTSIDPNWDPSGDWDTGLRPLLGLVDVFLPNAMEASRLTGTSDLERALEILGGLTSTVVIKTGPDGAIATAAGETVKVGAINAAVVDTTGAGDSFDAGFLAGFLDGKSLQACLALGNACGALSTRVAGGTEAQPTMDEALAAVESGSAS
jgi:sugar/nucleoside kinase (ribokinase family)